RPANDLYQLANGARRADMALPLLTEPGPHARQVGDPAGNGRAVAVRLQHPANPFAHFSDRVGHGDADRDDQEDQNEDDRKRGADCRIAAGVAQQLAIERPAGKADHQGGEHRNEEAVEEINAGDDDQNEQPAGGGDRRYQCAAAGSNRAEPALSLPWVGRSTHRFLVLQLAGRHMGPLALLHKIKPDRSKTVTAGFLPPLMAGYLQYGLP